MEETHTNVVANVTNSPGSPEHKNIVSYPLKTIEETLKYATIEIKNLRKSSIKFNLPVIKNSVNGCHQKGHSIYPRNRYNRSAIPKTLVCHDFKGGYVEDKYENGCNISDGYTFYRWSNIDIFVYFSHNLVTIPPPGWISCAHRNDVKILGTFITEWDDGTKLCHKILQSEETYKNFANALVNICVYYSFDGYLLNIENNIQNTLALCNFVKYLTDQLHATNPEFVVLWYDSVTIEGKLQWQNELNHKNKCFFDVCDGIFLNYTWNETNLKNSCLSAGPRYLDVFVGIDVFGRNCYGGGGFLTDVAANMSRKHNLSIAIFAQGWTHETLVLQSNENFYESFVRRDTAFWLKLIPYLYTHSIKNGSFGTFFYIGADRESFNLNMQELALSRPAHCGKHDLLYNKFLECCDCIQINFDGYLPQTFSYKLTKHSFEKNREYLINLFVCDIHVSNQLSIKTFTKSVDEKSANLEIVMLAKDKNGHFYNIYGSIEHTYDTSNRKGNFQSIYANEKYKLGYTERKWRKCKYIFQFPKPLNVLEIGAIVHGESILFGGIEVQINI